MRNKTSVFPIYLVFLLDTFGLAIVYPLFGPLFLDNVHGFFLPNAPLGLRTTLLGVAIAAFPLAQLFGAPIIGELSDRIGRKRAFIGTITGTTIGYVLTACAILFSSVPLLFFGRLWTGFFAGNLTLCLAALADLNHTAKERTRSFGRLASLGGLCFILGILAGGSLSGESFFHSLDPSVPFWLTAGISFVNLILILGFYHDRKPQHFSGVLNIWRGIQNLKTVFREKHLSLIYMVFFFYMSSWVTSMQFFSAFLIEEYQATPKIIEFALVGVGLIWALTNGIVGRKLSFSMPPAKILVCALPILSISLFATVHLEPFWAFMSIFGLAVFCSALIWTNTLARVSLLADEKMQGRILGVNQSLGALAAIFGPVTGGVLASFGSHWVYFFTGICAALGFIFLLIESRK